MEYGIAAVADLSLNLCAKVHLQWIQKVSCTYALLRISICPVDRVRQPTACAGTTIVTGHRGCESTIWTTL